MSFRVTLSVTIASSAFGILLVSPIAAATVVTTPHRFHHQHAHHKMDRWTRNVEGVVPYQPEYGFLSRIPSNAIRMPGYTFVPGVGILGASCDLPTSACSNEYRDIQ
jgi:hypothetical protein